jgi:hypothetical protein
LSRQPETPFDSIENARDYLRLLLDTVAEVKRDVEADIVVAEANSERRLEALRLVRFKLERLEHYLRSSSRSLNDLRTLRRLLLEERSTAASAGERQKAS